MRIGFDKANFGVLADLWNATWPSRYSIDAELLQANTVDSPTFDWGASIIEIDDSGPAAFVAIKKSPAQLYKGPDPDTAHIAAIAFRNPAAGIDLLAYAKKILVNRGAYRLVFGQDSRHFWPGAPIDVPALKDFLTIQGFAATGEQFDLERNLEDYLPPDGALRPLFDFPGCPAPSASGPRVRAARSEDVEGLRAHLQTEFPGRWRHDVMHKIEIEERPDFVYVLDVDGKIEGFALTQDWTHHLPISGAVWRGDLGERWGALGPIGVAKRVRGKGLGDALLAASLMGLKGRGAKRTIIDWTTLVDFYGRHGFEVSRRYTTVTLSLAQ